MIAAALLLSTALPGPSVSYESLHSLATASSVYAKPFTARMEFFARQFLGTPYVAFTLDQETKTEQCTVVLDGLDCVTFMETVLNLSRARAISKESVVGGVTFTRYWGGKVNGYLSRLHYTSDWIYDNERKGVVKDISDELPGASRFTKEVGYMSANPDKYNVLKANPSLVPQTKKMEEASNARTKWYVPIWAIKEAEKQLQTGDIIALTGGPKGIDCTHVGLIIVEGGVPHFVHASSVGKKVVFDARLSDYLKGSKTTGIMVARPTGR